MAGAVLGPEGPEKGQPIWSGAASSEDGVCGQDDRVGGNSELQAQPQLQWCG